MIRVKNKELYSLKDIRNEQIEQKNRQTGKIIAKKVYFSSMQAMLKGAWQFVDFFGRLHNEGKVYASSDPSCFFFGLSKGEFSFNGGDLVGKQGDAFRLEQTPVSEFLAPELVTAGQGGGKWDLETDWYFMAVFLFEYFFHTGSPFEGRKMVNHCFLSPEEKESYRAEEGIFCMEPGDHGNEPVLGIQDKLIRYWDQYPDLLRKMFQRAFLSGGNLITLRPTELDWKQVLVKLIMDYKECSCGFKAFSDKLVKKQNGIRLCPECGRSYYPLSDGLEEILLTEGGKVYECQTGLDACNFDKVTGLVVENRKKKGLFGIKNISDGVWTGFYPDGVTREIPKDQVIPVWSGMTLRFERGEDWTLRIARAEAYPQEEDSDEDTIRKDNIDEYTDGE